MTYTKVLGLVPVTEILKDCVCSLVELIRTKAIYAEIAQNKCIRIL